MTKRLSLLCAGMVLLLLGWTGPAFAQGGRFTPFQESWLRQQFNQISEATNAAANASSWTNWYHLNSNSWNSVVGRTSVWDAAAVTAADWAAWKTAYNLYIISMIGRTAIWDRAAVDATWATNWATTNVFGSGGGDVWKGSNQVFTGRQGFSNTVDLYLQSWPSADSSAYRLFGYDSQTVATISSDIGTNVQLLLHANGTNLSTWFPDSSSNNCAIVANGDAKVSTTSPQLGNGSLVLDGIGDYLSCTNTVNWNFGTANWSVDLWVKPNGAVTPTVGLIGADQTPDSGWSIAIPASGKPTLISTASGGAALDLATSNALPINTWTHLAFCRTGNILKVFTNGVLDGQAGCSGYNYGATRTLVVGRYYNNDNNYYFKGNLDEIRIVSSVSSFTNAFTPPGTEYGTAYTGTNHSYYLYAIGPDGSTNQLAPATGSAQTNVLGVPFADYSILSGTASNVLALLAFTNQVRAAQTNIPQTNQIGILWAESAGIATDATARAWATYGSNGVNTLNGMTNSFRNAANLTNRAAVAVSDWGAATNDMNFGNHCLTNVSNVSYIPKTAPATTAEGDTYWDSTEHTMSFQSDISNVTLNVGLENWVRVVNKEDFTITNGMVLALTNFPGLKMAVVLCRDFTTTDTHHEPFAVATHDIAKNAEGFATTFGLVRDLDTSGWNEADTLYLSTTPGQLTNAYAGLGIVSPHVIATVADKHNIHGSIHVTIGKHEEDPWYFQWMGTNTLQTQISTLLASTNNFVRTNDTRQLDLSNTNNNIHVAYPNENSDAASKEYVDNELAMLTGGTLYGATNAHPYNADWMQFRDNIPPPWTNVYSLPTAAGDSIVGKRVMTNALTVTIQAGTYVSHDVYASASENGLGSYRSQIVQVYSNTGVGTFTTNVLGETASWSPTTWTPGPSSPFPPHQELSFQFASNIVFQTSPTQYLGVVRIFNKIGAAAGKTFTIYGGTNQPTHFNLPSAIINNTSTSAGTNPVGVVWSDSSGASTDATARANALIGTTNLPPNWTGISNTAFTVNNRSSTWDTASIDAAIGKTNVSLNITNYVNGIGYTNTGFNLQAGTGLTFAVTGQVATLNANTHHYFQALLPTNMVITNGSVAYTVSNSIVLFDTAGIYNASTFKYWFPQTGVWQIVHHAQIRAEGTTAAFVQPNAYISVFSNTTAVYDFVGLSTVSFPGAGAAQSLQEGVGSVFCLNVPSTNWNILQSVSFANSAGQGAMLMNNGITATTNQPLRTYFEARHISP